MNTFTHGDVGADFMELMNQASMTSHEYFQKAQECLENSGLNFTAADVVALASVSAHDYRSGILAGTLSGISNALSSIADKLENLDPTEGFDNAASAIRNIANELEASRLGQ